jgi:hypothetical protein
MCYITVESKYTGLNQKGWTKSRIRWKFSHSMIDRVIAQYNRCVVPGTKIGLEEERGPLSRDPADWVCSP